MTGSYIVTMRAKRDGGGFHDVRCKTNQDLANLLTHIDNDEYEIYMISTDVKIIEDDISMYCKKDKKLETGKE